MEKQLIKKIEKIRDYMHDLINIKENLNDPEILMVSKILDSKLNEYNKLSK